MFFLASPPAPPVQSPLCPVRDSEFGNQSSTRSRGYVLLDPALLDSERPSGETSHRWRPMTEEASMGTQYLELAPALKGAVATRITAAIRPFAAVFDPDNFDEDTSLPSETAVHDLLSLVAHAYAHLAADIPAPTYTLMDDGGFSLRWRNGERQMTVKVPPGGIFDGHLYFYEADDQDHLERIVSPSLVVRRLTQLYS